MTNEEIYINVVKLYFKRGASVNEIISIMYDDLLKFKLPKSKYKFLSQKYSRIVMCDEQIFRLRERVVNAIISNENEGITEGKCKGIKKYINENQAITEN